jgi:flagellar biosynthesis protein FlhF
VRIKRFIAPDMRTALRMVRDEQGPDAVILSNRAIDGGIEVVAATDYDESLVSQALRAALPGMDAAPAAPLPAAPIGTMPAPVMAAVATMAMPAAEPLPTASAVQRIQAAEPAMATASVATATRNAQRESLAARARAVFKIGDGPTLAELTATAKTPAPAVAAHADPVVQATAPASIQHAAIEPTVLPATVAATPTNAFEAMMAALDPVEPAASVVDGDADCLAIPANVSALPTAPIDLPAANEDKASSTDAPEVHEAQTLRVIDTAAEQADPAILSMRAELSSMRQLIERQMEQYSLERLRGSPARAAAYEALLEFGCEDVLAQAVAAKIDPRLDPAQILEPMLAELSRMIATARSETIDDGGVIALVGPTGSGKTTTAAKLAARFAARHRARDVALVTTDGERAGAREQLHAHGRRLGITVCEAAGPEGLQSALAQLTDYPLVIVDTPGYSPRDRGLFGQILWLHQSRNVRSLLVLPANAHPHDLSEVVRRYGPAAPEGVVLTKVDESGRLGSALSVAVRHGLPLAYTTHGQNVPDDIDTADATRLARTLEKVRRAADNPLAPEERHAVA